VSMKFAVVAAVVRVSVSLVGCAQPPSLGSLSRTPDARIPKRSTPEIQVPPVQWRIVAIRCW
jgi:hypothetical protein